MHFVIQGYYMPDFVSWALLLLVQFMRGADSNNITEYVSPIQGLALKTHCYPN